MYPYEVTASRHPQEAQHFGFWRNPKRFNVAITRAKALLVVVGHPLVLVEVTLGSRLFSIWFPILSPIYVI